MDALYKVGDQVTIVTDPLLGKFHYRTGFNKGMQKLSGKTFIIKEVYKSTESVYPFNDDGYNYRINDSIGYTWTSNHFINGFYKNPTIF